MEAGQSEWCQVLLHEPRSDCVNPSKAMWIHDDDGLISYSIFKSYQNNGRVIMEGSV